MKSAKLALLMILLALSSTALTAAARAQEPPAGGPGELAAQVAEAGLEPQEKRVEFNLGLSGGRVVGTAGDFQYREGLFLLAVGGVELKYKDLQIRADIMRLELQTELLTAEGEVILDEGPQRLTGETLEYDLSTKTGRVTQATAYVDPDYYFSGSQIAKVDESTYTIDDGVFTSCDQDVPSWSIHLSDARITLEKYARIKNARLKLGKVPVFYSPYLVWPATTDRATGLLVPKPGFSDRRGASLDLAYYVTLGRSADTTFFFDAATEGFFGFGNETRYRPSEKTEGSFRAYVLSQPDDLYDVNFPSPSDEFRPVFEPTRPADDLRWKFELSHETNDLWGRFRGVVNITEYSDFDYLQDFERNVGRQTRSFIYSNAHLTSNFGQHSFNILADQRERILVQPRSDVRRQLPEVEYRLRPTQLGNTPLYFSLDSSAHFLSIEQSNANGGSIVDNRYARAHVAPTLSIPVSTLSWLSAKVNLGGRATYYTDSLGRDEDGSVTSDFGGDGLDRFVADSGLEVVGPVFSRIFDKKLGRFGKVKHIIEPRLTYRFIDDFDDQQQIFRFDEIDSLGTTNAWTFSLFNRLMGKPSDPDDGGALEVASIELRQSFSLDDERPLQRSALDPMLTTKEGPLAALLRINPSRATSVRLDLRYSTLFDELQSMSFSGGTKLGHHSLGLTWFTNWRVEDSAQLAVNPLAARAGDKTSEQIRLFGKLAILPRRLTLDAEVSYDTIASEIRHQRYFINWDSKCYSWQLELRESIRGAIEDRDVRFSLTLKHVGTFLDLNQSL